MPRVLQLAEPLRQRLIAEAEAHPDTEVCGLLGGPDGRPRTVLPVPNRLARGDAFDMDPRGLIDAMRHLRETDQELVAIYHSHPFSPPHPSATDRARNQYPEAVHLILGREAGAWGLRAFRLDGEARAQPLATGPDGPRWLPTGRPLPS